jgi:hypothetical protein
MTSFPWGVSIGLAIILTFTFCCISYILLLDKIEEHQSNVRVQNQNNTKNN